MSYQVDRGPKIIFGTIAAVVLAFFASVAAYDVFPYYHERYQRHQIQQCENTHKVATGTWILIFGFDMGGRRIVADSPESRALIECIVDNLSVRYATSPFYSDQNERLPALKITYSSFNSGLSLDYYDGNGANESIRN